eukprot:scaffold25049_cov127-Cylindrotheca_fusiformis.AAC.1
MLRNSNTVYDARVVVLVVALLVVVSDAFSAVSVGECCRMLDHSPTIAPVYFSTKLHSSFYEDFEDFDDEDEEDDDDEEDDEYDEMDAQSIAAFRSKMGNLFGDSEDSESDVSSVDELINYARSQADPTEKKVKEWASPTDTIKPGVVLVANPEIFCDFSNPSGSNKASRQPDPSLLSKFGLVRPPPRDLGPDRQADLLPVIVVVEQDQHSTKGVLLNRRTGYLLGDLEQPDPKIGESMQILEKFCIQPLWFGGTDNASSGLDMLHKCETVVGAKQITGDGLYWGGDPSQAQEAMEDPALGRVVTGFDFKFFVQNTHWLTRNVEKQLAEGVWFAAEVSTEVLFKSRDRMGTQKAKPLWTEIMELMGGDYQKVKESFYES